MSRRNFKLRLYKSVNYDKIKKKVSDSGQEERTIFTKDKTVLDQVSFSYNNVIWDGEKFLDIIAIKKLNPYGEEYYD